MVGTCSHLCKTENSSEKETWKGLGTKPWDGGGSQGIWRRSWKKRRQREEHCDRTVSGRQGDRASDREVAERGGRVYGQDLGSRQPQGRRLGSYGYEEAEGAGCPPGSSRLLVATEALDLRRTLPTTRRQGIVAGPLMSYLVLKGHWVSLAFLTEVALAARLEGGRPAPVSRC